MHTTTFQRSGRAAAWLRAGCLCLLGTVAGLAQAAAPTQIWHAVSDRTLDTQRGGFSFGGGLEVSFGITRSVFINGELITETVLNIARLADITPAWAARLREELQSLTLVQNGPGNTFVAGTAPTTVPPATATYGGASSSTPTSTAGSSGNGISNANTAIAASTRPPTAVSPTYTAVTSAIAGTANGTVIQNTLNNQQILHQTIINATSNGLGMLRLSTLHSTLSEAIRQSVGLQ
ncbi:MAG: hypothetical protein V4794_01820 [Pseudomonadota bacterium]